MGEAEKVIIAVDFDGILCENEYPGIGKPHYEMIAFVMQMQDAGIETILWTSRVNDRLKEAVKWCEDRGLHFAAINANAPSNLAKFGTDPRKVFANLYIDDNTPWFQSDMDDTGRYEINIAIGETRKYLKKKGVKL